MPSCRFVLKPSNLRLKLYKLMLTFNFKLKLKSKCFMGNQSRVLNVIYQRRSFVTFNDFLVLVVKGAVQAEVDQFLNSDYLTNMEHNHQQNLERYRAQVYAASLDRELELLVKTWKTQLSEVWVSDADGVCKVVSVIDIVNTLTVSSQLTVTVSPMVNAKTNNPEMVDFLVHRLTAKVTVWKQSTDYPAMLARCMLKVNQACDSRYELALSGMFENVQEKVYNDMIRLLQLKPETGGVHREAANAISFYLCTLDLNDFLRQPPRGS